MNICIVVSAKLLLLLSRKGSQRLLNITIGVLAADHEANLAGRVGRDGGVCVLDGGEDFLTVLLELGDQWQVEPLVLGYAKGVSWPLKILKWEQQGSGEGLEGLGVGCEIGIISVKTRMSS